MQSSIHVGKRLLLTTKNEYLSSVTQSCPTFCDPMDRSTPGLTAAAAAAKSLQSCLTLCDPRDGSSPGFPSLGFSRQEHWSSLPFPSPMHESEK